MLNLWNVTNLLTKVKGKIESLLNLESVRESIFIEQSKTVGP